MEISFYMSTYILFIYQDEDENQTFRSFLYALKQTCKAIFI